MDKPARKIQVLIVDDHPMLRERMGQLINMEPDLEVSGEAASVQQAMEQIRLKSPDIAVVDITLKGSSGLELLKDLRAQQIELPVLVLSMHDESLYADRALRAGARGYITKEEASENVIDAIRCVLRGDVYLSKEFTSKLLKRIVDPAAKEKGNPVDVLADRELEVFRLMGAGRTTKEIAEALHLGWKTVNTYRERIKRKLSLKNAAELYNAAARHQQL